MPQQYMDINLSHHLLPVVKYWLAYVAPYLPEETRDFHNACKTNSLKLVASETRIPHDVPMRASTQ